MKADGTGRSKITPEPILDVISVSPDGRWVIAGSTNPDQEHSADTKAFAVDGSRIVPVCHGYCGLNWDNSGKFAYLGFLELHEGTYVLPVLHDTGLPKLPPAGITRLEDFTNAKVVPIPGLVQTATNGSIYAYTRQNTRRNLYRVPLP